MDIIPDEETDLPEELSALLWDLIIADMEHRGLDGGLIECSLEAERSSGGPIQKITFLDNQHRLYGINPVDRKFLVFISPQERELIPIGQERRENHG